MNCSECKENLVAHMEGALDEATALSCQNHIESCKECSETLREYKSLQGELGKLGPITADVSLVDSVMNRVKYLEFQKEAREPERSTFMSKLLKWRWSMGLGAFAGILGLILLVILPGSNTMVAAEETFARATKAVGQLAGINIKGRLRTSAHDNFSAIALENDFVDIELWKEFSPKLRWKVEKPGRVAAMNGSSTILFIRPDFAYKLDTPTQSAFDTQWLHQIADVAESLNDELRAIKKHDWKSSVSKDNAGHTVVTVEARSGYSSDDYLKNTFFCTADTRRVYVFDDQTGLLVSAKIYLADSKQPELLFELTQINYNPNFASDTFEIELPDDVSWNKDDVVLPDNSKYEALSSEQAARAFFDACAQENWDEVSKFTTVTASLKTYLAGIEVISIGEHFESALSLISGAQFVPYEIRLKSGEVKKHNLALKRHPQTRRWFVDGGI